MNYKTIAIIEAVIIILLSLVYLIDLKQEQVPKEGLLSPRVYTNLLQQQSRLIYNLEPLEEGIKNYASKINGTVGVYLLNLRDGANLGINEEIEFEPASLNKIPLAILIFREIEKGEISLESKIRISENFIDDSSGTLYKKKGQDITIKEAIDEMLINSDNTAAKILLNDINPVEWNALSEYLNYYQAENNLSQANYATTPEAIGNLFSSLYLSTLLKKDNSEYILKRLTQSNFPIRELARIPGNITISHKFGTYYGKKEEYYHDCGIIYLKEGSRFAYCIMTKDISSKEAEKVIGTIAGATYKYILEESNDNFVNQRL